MRKCKQILIARMSVGASAAVLIATGFAGPALGASGAPTSTSDHTADSTSRQSVAHTGTVLRRGDHLDSPKAHLTMQQNGNLVVLDENGAVRWHTGTWPHGDRAVFQNDGNLVVYTAQGRAIWSSGTSRRPGATLAVQDDGNVVIYTKSGVAAWHTGTHH